MAVENRKATAVTNADASPTQQFNPTRILGGRVKEEVGTIELANGDSIASVNRFGRVSSGWRVSQLLLSTDAITGAAADIGLYDTAANGGAVVDADLFGSAVSLASAQSGVDVAFEAGDIANAEKAIWELLGLTSDPGKQYDVAATLTAAATAGGTAALRIRYVDGN